MLSWENREGFARKRYITDKRWLQSPVFQIETTDPNDLVRNVTRTPPKCHQPDLLWDDELRLASEVVSVDPRYITIRSATVLAIACHYFRVVEFEMMTATRKRTRSRGTGCNSWRWRSGRVWPWPLWKNEVLSVCVTCHIRNICIKFFQIDRWKTLVGRIIYIKLRTMSN